MGEYRIRTRQDAEGMWVFDGSRRRWLRMTPEERVRQVFVKFLVEFLDYPLGLICTEMPLEVNGLRRRADIVVFRGGKPFAVVECKAPTVQLTQAVVDQVVDYHRALMVDYLVVTNGPDVHYIALGGEEQPWRFVDGLPACEI